MSREPDIRTNDKIIIKGILHQNLPAHSRVYVFGSRARETAKKYSDLDLAIDMQGGIPFDLMSKLNWRFEESDLPYKVDVVDLNNIAAHFKKIIEKDLILFPF